MQNKKANQKRLRTAGLYKSNLLIRLSRMLSLARFTQIYLRPSGRKSSRIFAPHAEQKKLCHIAKIESNPATIRATILPDLAPNNIAFVRKPQADITDNPSGSNALGHHK